MAFIPTIASAQKNINSARTILQDAEAQVAEGRAQLQAEVDAGRLTPGTQEFLNARNQLVNSRQSFAETARIQYNEDLAALDQAREFEQGAQPTVLTPASTTLAPNEIPPNTPDPALAPTVSSSNIDPRATAVDPDTDPVADLRRGSGQELAVPTADVRDQAEIPTNTSGYGEEDELAVPTADVRTAPSIIGDEDAQQAAFQTFAAAGDEDAQQAPFGVFNSQNRVQVGTIQAQRQETTRALAQFPVNTDWRVVLRLAPGANYLYAAPDAGLLQPLKTTNGVVFPYTPSITTAYKANYSEYNLTHSNYRGYFYQNSYTDTVQLNATFTAQSTADAAYVLAVIHFFRSVTKMFYGNDAQRGSPPPLVYLSGLGDYQFNNHPCLVSQFNYSLPADVDYISSGSPNNLGLNLQPLQNLYSTTLNAVAPTVTRLATAFLPRGAENERPAPLQALLNNPTYVPSKIDIQLSLFPVQSRSAVSKQFSLKNFANGNLLKGGFW
jgi:hypothetical protein